VRLSRARRAARLLPPFLLLIVLPGSLLGESVASAIAQSSPTTTQAGTALPPPGPVIVALRNDVITAASDVAAATDLEPTQTYSSVISGFAAEASASEIRELARNPLVANIIADTPVELFAQYTPTSVKRSGFAKYPEAAIDGIDQVINADIAFLDSGIAASHGDLNVAGGTSCISGSSPYHDATKHGTHTAGVAAARDNDFGVVGAAPSARIWSVKVFNDSGQGSQSTVLCGLDWVVSSGTGIEVVNLSIGNNSGSPAVSQCYSQVDPLHDAICAIHDSGMTIVAAAGNSSVDAATYNYSKFPETIGVAAITDYNGWPGGGAVDRCGYGTGPDDSFANYSNFGAVVDIAAPGSCILSTVPGGYEHGFGTSMAAPLVAGAAALYLAQNPGATPAAVRSWLLSDAASKPQSSSVGYTGGSTGTNRVLYLGAIPSGSNPPGTTNPPFTGSKLAVASVIDAPSTTTAQFAYDGDPGTVWTTPSTSPLTAQLRFDLGSAARISGVKWKFNPTGRADEFTIRLFNTSTDGRVFGPFGNASQANIFLGQDVSGNVAYRYVEFFLENPRNRPALGSISEVEIWGETGASGSPGVIVTNPSFTGAKTPIVNSASTPSAVPATTAHDSSFYTNWHSGHSYPASASLRFDLGASRSVTGVKWRFYGLGFADSFTVKLFDANGGEIASYGPFGNGTSGSAWYGFSVPSTSARFVRFYFANPNRDSAVGSIAEVEIWTLAPSLPSGTVNPSFSGAKASIANSASTPSIVLASFSHDGSLATNWHSGHSSPASASLRFDLGSTKTITGVKWRFASPGFADRFTVKLVNASGAEVGSFGPFGNGTTSSSFYGFDVAGTSALYVRFYFDNPNGDSALGSIAEIEIWTSTPLSPGTANPSFGGSELPVINSASTPDTVPASASHDNNLGTNWHSAHVTPSTASLRFDLGADRSLTGVKWRFAYTGYADQFTVKVFDAYGTEVASYGPFGNGTSTSNSYGFNIPGSRAKFVRFYFDNPNGDSALGSLAEVEVWGEEPAPFAAETAFAGMSLPITESEATAGDPAAAHDGDAQTTFAASAAAPTTVRFDLGGERDLTGLRWQSASDTLVTLRLSLDGTTWTAVGTFANQPDGTIWQGTALPDGTRAQYVEVDLAAGAVLGEFEVWGLVELPEASPEASPVASPDAATPLPVETETPDASPAPLQPTAEPTESPTEPAASPAPATETLEPTATLEPTPTETLEPTATATETVEPTATSTSEPTAEPTAAISLGTITGTDGDAVNCRAAPIDGDPITQLTEGEQVEVTGEAVDGWLPVRCAGQPGWIAEQFVTLGIAEPTEEATEPTEEAGVTATATTDGEATAEPTEEPTEEPVEKPYPVYDTGDTEDSGIAWNVLDGDSSTAWLVTPSQSPEQARLYLDLGSVVPIDRIEIKLAQEGLLPYFELWLSEDGETWYNATPNGINGWNLWAGEAHVFELGYDARYVRIVIPNVDESGLAEVGGIAEIAVWPGDITQTQYLTALGEPTTPTPAPVAEEPTTEPTEEVVEEPTEEVVEEPAAEPTEEVVEEPTEEPIPTEEIPVEETVEAVG
jgi:subtilisin family serine protease